MLRHQTADTCAAQLPQAGGGPTAAAATGGCHQSAGHRGAVRRNCRHWCAFVPRSSTAAAGNSLHTPSRSALAPRHLCMWYTKSAHCIIVTEPVQCVNMVMTSSTGLADDDRLLKWTKVEQPVIPGPPPGLRVTGFRDPYVIQQGGKARQHCHPHSIFTLCHDQTPVNTFVLGVQNVMVPAG